MVEQQMSGHDTAECDDADFAAAFVTKRTNLKTLSTVSQTKEALPSMKSIWEGKAK